MQVICTSLQSPDRQPRQHLIRSLFFSGWMLFQPPNQQRESIINNKKYHHHQSITNMFTAMNIKFITWINWNITFVLQSANTMLLSVKPCLNYTIMSDGRCKQSASHKLPSDISQLMAWPSVECWHTMLVSGQEMTICDIVCMLMSKGRDATPFMEALHYHTYWDIHLPWSGSYFENRIIKYKHNY